jgi:ubiquitin conjugation factor E4 B
VNARSIEMLTIMGPFLSRLSIFPDSDPSLPVKYFGSNGILPDELDTINGIGSRNNADVKTAKNAMRDSSAVVQVFLSCVTYSYHLITITLEPLALHYFDID